MILTESRTEHLSGHGRVSHRVTFHRGRADRRDHLGIDIDAFKESHAVAGRVIEKTVRMEDNCFATVAITQSEEAGLLGRSGIQREESFRVGDSALVASYGIEDAVRSKSQVGELMGQGPNIRAYACGRINRHQPAAVWDCCLNYSEQNAVTRSGGQGL